mmetsp:Transcript_1717/g.3596  ORF Transcript_1717/g.3596 Transcript_1717/m.3596 type:complete len:253 (-) Transcript_1717:405-1163(-)
MLGHLALADRQGEDHLLAVFFPDVLKVVLHVDRALHLEVEHPAELPRLLDIPCRQVAVCDELVAHVRGHGPHRLEEHEVRGDAVRVDLELRRHEEHEQHQDDDPPRDLLGELLPDLGRLLPRHGCPLALLLVLGPGHQADELEDLHEAYQPHEPDEPDEPGRPGARAGGLGAAEQGEEAELGGHDGLDEPGDVEDERDRAEKVEPEEEAQRVPALPVREERHFDDKKNEAHKQEHVYHGIALLLPESIPHLV